MLLLRADAGTRMGTGHVMRCIALAQAWQDAGGEAHFVAAELPDGLAARLTEEGMALHRLDGEVVSGSSQDAAHTAALVRELGAEWLVVDGYHFDGDYQRAIKDAGLRLLVIDDYGHADHYWADIVLNQNIYAGTVRYQCEPDTRLLLGTEYVLLRREFRRWQGWKRIIPEVARKVLVTMGGSDPDNVTLTVMEAIEGVEVSGLEVVVVVGTANPYRQVLEQVAAGSRHQVCVVSDVRDMPDLMAWADVAVSAAGSTSWELAFMGLPSVVIVVAENQREVAGGLELACTAVNCGWHERMRPEGFAEAFVQLCNTMATRDAAALTGPIVVDGCGADRLIDVISGSSSKATELKLRQAGPSDALRLWQLANDPEVRRNAFHPAPIPLMSHLEWFERRLNSPDCLMMIAELGDLFVGQVRFDRVDNAVAEIDFAVEVSQRGHGYGTQMLSRTCAVACWVLHVQRLSGVVMLANSASAATFCKAGFRWADETTMVDRYECHVFNWICDQCLEFTGARLVEFPQGRIS